MHRHILQLAGSEDPIPPSEHHINKSPGQESSMQLTQKYMSTLDRDQVKKLIEIYKFDFEAFGYDSGEFVLD